MTYLLDVNALVAILFLEHVFHDRAARWVRAVAKHQSRLATCAISELGFLRVLAQTPAYQIGIAQGKDLLADLHNSTAPVCSFIADDVSGIELPRWVKSPGQLTDGHLLRLARKHGASLATFDKSIPGAFLITG